MRVWPVSLDLPRRAVVPACPADAGLPALAPLALVVPPVRQEQTDTVTALSACHHIAQAQIAHTQQQSLQHTLIKSLRVDM